MQDNISPEEKLLRLIKDPKKAPLPGMAIGAAQTARRKFSFSFRPGSSPADLQKYALALLAAAIVYLVVALARPFFGFRKITLEAGAGRPAEQNATVASEEVKPFDFYAAPLMGRNIFVDYGTAAPSSEGAVVQVAAADMVKDISLVGIIMGENPQAVIEDKAAQRTIYVSKGQSIREMQIDDIQEGKIILSHKGEKFELTI